MSIHVANGVLVELVTLNKVTRLTNVYFQVIVYNIYMRCYRWATSDKSSTGFSYIIYYGCMHYFQIKNDSYYQSSLFQLFDAHFEYLCVLGLCMVSTSLVTMGIFSLVETEIDD